MRKIISIILTGCLLVGLSACSNVQSDEEQAPSSREFFAMNTYISLTAYGNQAENALAQAQKRIEELENLWSVTEENSDIFAVNHSDGQAVAVSEDTAEIVSFALEMADATDGALEPTIYPVLTAWGFTTDEHHVPNQEEIDRLLKYVDYSKVSVNGNEIRLPAEMMLDLGAVGKGYASDEIAELLKKEEITSSLLNLGGNIVMIGSSPDGSPWRLGLQSPFEDDMLGVLIASDCAVVTSGNYENNFIGEDGTVYGHIIDPTTGYPVNNELASVTIVAEEGKLCDALSTSLFVMGVDGAIGYWRDNPEFNMILVTQDHQLLLTEELEEQFTLGEAYSDMEVQVITK